MTVAVPEEAAASTRVCLLTVAREELRRARHGRSGWSARLVAGGGQHDPVLAVVGLRRGAAYHHEAAPGAWTLQVLQGRIRMLGPVRAVGYPGDLLVVTAPRTVTADTDCAFLLTAPRTDGLSWSA